MKRSTLIPLLLLVYLGVMVYLGWPGYKSGANSPALYFGGTAFTILVIVLLHFNLKKREKYRRERMERFNNPTQKPADDDVKKDS